MNTFLSTRLKAQSRRFPRVLFALLLGLSAGSVSVHATFARVAAVNLPANPPVLLTIPNTTRAFALENISDSREPFSPTSSVLWSSDNRNRIWLYAQNLNLQHEGSLAAVTADAQDESLQFHSLTVEHVEPVPECPDFTRVLVRLADELGDIGDVLVSISVYGMRSNRVRVGIGHLGGGPPDDPIPGLSINGQVTDSSGNAVSSVTVNLENASGALMTSMVSGSDGTFHFCELPAGTTVTVRPAPTMYVTFAPRTFTNITANEQAVFIGEPRLYNISGRVVSNTGSGLNNANITLTDGVSPLTALTDSNGNYCISGVTAGRNIIITAALAGFTILNPSVSIPTLDSDKASVNFAAQPEATPTPTPTSTPTPVPGSVPADPNSTGYSWVNCTRALDFGITASSGIITRTAPGSGYQQAYSQCNEQIAYGTGAIAIRISSTSDVLRFGLTNSGAWSITPSAIMIPLGSAVMPNLTGPSYGFALTGSGNYEIWNQERERMFKANVGVGTFQPGDWAIVYSDEGKVKYYRDRGGVLTLLYTSDHNPLTVSYPLLPQISISSNATQAQVKILKPSPIAYPTYVSVSGTFYADGSISNPMSLTKAINGSRPTGVPDNNIILMPGTYSLNDYQCHISGTQGHPVIIRPQNQVWPPDVKLELAANAPSGAVNWKFFGNYVWLRDVESYFANTLRWTNTSGSNPPYSDMPRAITSGMSDVGTGNKFINILAHDMSSGINPATAAAANEVYGCIDYNNGWEAPDRGHGHGMYIQHEQTGANAVSISNNVVFNNYSGYAIHVFNRSAANLGGYHLYSNIIINDLFAVVGDASKADVIAVANLVYGSGMKFGYGNEINGDATITDNVSYAPRSPIEILYWNNLTVARNKMVEKASTEGAGFGFRKPSPSTLLTNYSFSQNEYWRGLIGWPLSSTPNFTITNQSSFNGTWAAWQSLGFDTNGTYHVGTDNKVAVRPNGIWTNVLPNMYQSGRGQIVIWNWDLTAAAQVDISRLGLLNGQTYKIFDVQNPTVLWASGRYDSSNPTITIVLPNASSPVAQPIGNPAKWQHTTVEFNAFLVVPGPRP